MTRATACSTVPIAFPNNPPTALPTFLALRLVAAGIFEAAFPLRLTFPPRFEGEPEELFFFRLMTGDFAPTLRRFEDGAREDFLSPAIPFLGTVCFKVCLLFIKGCAIGMT
ncbi:MAG: hypothetical protein K0S45_3516 [Nitrospira sp.]|jgi:hypothetical protein|nr:hypothetical protein [Nitrospira sp.]